MSNIQTSAFVSEDFATLFLERIQAYNQSMQTNMIHSEKDKIDNIFFDNVKNACNSEEISGLFKCYMLFYKTYQEFISNNMKLFFLNNVRSELKSFPENVIRKQKRSIDNAFSEKIRSVQTVEDTKNLFNEYLDFFDTYQQLVTEDFITLFLNKIHSDYDSVSLSIIQEEKNTIDEIFFNKLKNAIQLENIDVLFKNYSNFFHMYQEFLTSSND